MIIRESRASDWEISEHDIRLSQLQQIPLFALRRKLIAMASDPDNAGVLILRFQDILDQRSRKLETTINKLTRAKNQNR